MNPETFKSKVLKVVSKIPRGTVMTYGEVARRAGNAKTARAVGMIVSQNYDAMIPCHRVIRSDGQVGGYNRGVRKKILLLKREGVL